MKIVGELDLFTVPQVRKATERLVAESRKMHFDLAELTFIDSTGLSYFAALHQAAQRDGFAFTMSRPSHRVLRPFELTTLDSVLPWANKPPR